MALPMNISVFQKIFIPNWSILTSHTDLQKETFSTHSFTENLRKTCS
jgi:hypothetical protein